MSERTWLRISAASGIAFAICVLTSGFIAGAPPTADASPDKISSFFVDNDTKLLAATYFQGLATVFFFWFLGALRERLSQAGSARLVTSLVAAAAATGALAMAGQAVGSAVAYRTAAAGNNDLTVALFDVQLMIFNMVAFGMAMIAAAAGLVMIRFKALSPWLGYGGLLSALVNLVAGASYAKDGVFLAGGWLGLVGFVGFVAFIVVTSVMMILEHAEEPATAGRMAHA
jgi:hypothetical protein